MFCALREGMDKADFYCSQMLIWVKDHVVIGRKDYLPMHELIAYGWHGRHKMERSKAKSVIFHPKPSRSKLHVTQKPVGLIRKLIPNSTKTGEWVFDGFGGGGFNNDRLRAFRTQMLHDRAIGGLLRYNHSPMGETYEFKDRKVTNSLT
jgi:hypothetical protein